jgi:hypothetical protein
LVRLFISHATEDKADFVRPLVSALKNHGSFEVWYDEFSLKAGDSLLRSIDKGMKECDYGIVVISPSFLSPEKKWTHREVEMLFTREPAGGKIIIPIWYKVGKKEVEDYSLLIADRLGIPGSLSMDRIVYEIERSTELVARAQEVQRSDWKRGFLELNDAAADRKANEQFGSTVEAVKEALERATELISQARARAEELIASLASLRFEIVDKPSRYSPSADRYLAVNGPTRIALRIGYENQILNSTRHAELRIIIAWRGDFGETDRVIEILVVRPKFNRLHELIWCQADDEGKPFGSSEDVLNFAFESFSKALRSAVKT